MPEFDINREPTTVTECERQQFYYEMLIKSYTAKVDRVEPGSLEFECTMNAIFKAQDALVSINAKRCSIIWKECNPTAGSNT